MEGAASAVIGESGASPGTSGSTVAEGDELGAHATPLWSISSRRESTASRSPAPAAASASWQSDASSSGSERPAVALQRVRRPPCTDCIARGCGLAQRLELGRSVCEEVVDELGEELRIVAHALAQLAEHGVVQCASQFRHVRTTGSRA